ncbi:CreA family protein, partial [Klebsiella pneumoniae]
MKYKKLVAGMLLLAGSQMAQAEQIGSVDTVFKFLGPDHKIVVEAFDDPDVQNVTCYISR